MNELMAENEQNINTLY